MPDTSIRPDIKKTNFCNVLMGPGTNYAVTPVFKSILILISIRNTELLGGLIEKKLIALDPCSIGIVLNSSKKMLFF